MSGDISAPAVVKMMSCCGTRALRALKQSSQTLIIFTTAAPQSPDIEAVSPAQF
jgi:hypothetical protein